MTLLETTDSAYRVIVDNAQRLLPRVTSVLSLVRDDLKTIPADVLQHAAERGKAVHRAVWLLEAGGDGSGLAWDTMHDELVPYVKAYQAAKDALRFDVLDKERLVVSALYGYAGRADLFVAWKNRVGVLDLKSGVEHPSHRLQVSAYVEGYRTETLTKKRLHRWILYLRPNGTYRLDACDRTTHEADFKVFCALLTAYRWLQEHGGNGQ